MRLIILLFLCTAGVFHVFGATVLISEESEETPEIPETPETPETNQTKRRQLFYQNTDGLLQLNISDPLPIPNFVFSINGFPLNESLLTGVLSVCDNAQIRGLSQVYLIPTILPQSGNLVDVIVGLFTETIHFTGSHALNFNIQQKNLLTNKVVTGEGGFDVEMVGAKIIAEMLINTANEKITISNLGVHISYDCLAMNMEGTKVNGSDLNWAEFSTQFKIDFDNHWKEISPDATRFWQGLANFLLRDCTINDLLNLDLGCIPGFPDESASDGDLLASTTGLLAQLFNSEEVIDPPTCPSRTGTSFLLPEKNSTATCNHLYIREGTTDNSELSSATTIKSQLILIFFTINFFLFKNLV